MFKGFGGTFGHHDQGPLLFILSLQQITFDLDSAETDVTAALSAAGFMEQNLQLGGRELLSTICSSDTFYPNKSCLTSNSLTSNNRDFHEISSLQMLYRKLSQ